MIWKQRNRVIHVPPSDRQQVIVDDIFPSVQWLSLFRMSNRCKKMGFSWACWVFNLRGVLVWLFWSIWVVFSWGFFLYCIVIEYVLVFCFKIYLFWRSLNFCTLPLFSFYFWVRIAQLFKKKYQPQNNKLLENLTIKKETSMIPNQQTHNN